jgi:hypothetical protein
VRASLEIELLEKPLKSLTRCRPIFAALIAAVPAVLNSSLRIVRR